MNFSANGFSIHVHTRIAEVRETWDAFHAGSRNLTSTYLSALEASRPADMEFRYVVVIRDDKIAGCAYLQVVNYTGKNFTKQGNAMLAAALKLFFSIKKVRLLFCGNLFSVDIPCLHYNEQLMSFDQMLGILQIMRKKEKCQLLMMKEVNDGPAQVKALMKRGFRKYEEDLTMALTIRPGWNSFEDYSGSLTKKYRKRLLLIRNAKEKITVKTLSGEEIRSFLPRIGELFAQTADRQFLKMGIIDERYFTELKKALGDQFFINGYFLNGKLIAFASHIIHTGLLELHYIGIEYALNNAYSLYFNILYDGVEQAIAMKKSMLELGRTAREAKASVGSVAVPSHDYLLVGNRVVNFLITVFEKIFLDKMGEEWKNRNPFKTTVTAPLEKIL
jgi:predicted N-acyltransferase